MHVCCGGGSCADTGDNITITCTCTDRAVSDVSFPTRTATQREPQPAAHAHRTGGARHSATLQLHSVRTGPHRLVSRECTQGSRVSRSYTVESGVPDWRAERRAFLHLVSGFRLHSRVLRRPCVRPPSYCTRTFLWPGLCCLLSLLPQVHYMKWKSTRTAHRTLLSRRLHRASLIMMCVGAHTCHGVGQDCDKNRHSTVDWLSRAALRHSEGILPSHDLGARGYGGALIDALLDELVLVEDIQHEMHRIIGARLLIEVEGCGPVCDQSARVERSRGRGALGSRSSSQTIVRREQ